MIFKRLGTLFYVNKLIGREIHKKYTMKIMCGIGNDCDQNSDAKAKNELVSMILDGKIAKNDITQICDTYMGTRETLVLLNGGTSRWVQK